MSGSVALMLQKNPTWTPDQVKAVLMGTTSPLKKADVQAQGKGLINMRNVAGAKAPGASTQKATPSTGTGTLEGSRGDVHLVLDGTTLTGEMDIQGQPFDATATAAAEAGATSWTDGTWNDTAWAGSRWTGTTWQATTWTGNTWTGSRWTARTWASALWDGSRWSNNSWTGSRWTGLDWTGSRWSDDAWN